MVWVEITNIFWYFRLASASRQPPSTSSKISKSSGEERRLSYDTLRKRHNTSEQEKELMDEEDEANKADDEGEGEGVVKIVSKF